jgi:hypothetical protein
MGRTYPPHEFHSSGFQRVDENEMDGNHLIVICTLHDQGNVIKFYALIDYGTPGYIYIDEDYAHCHHQPLHLLKSPRDLIIIDRRTVILRSITYITCTQEDIPRIVTKLLHYPIFLDIPCL